MKKWNNPELLNLEVQETKLKIDGYCDNCGEFILFSGPHIDWRTLKYTCTKKEDIGNGGNDQDSIS